MPLSDANTEAANWQRQGSGMRSGVVCCQVPGCTADISSLKAYYHRCRICKEHHAAQAIPVGGQVARFCQQCAMLQPVSEFHGSRRSCMAALARHNARRQRKAQVRCIAWVIACCL